MKKKHTLTRLLLCLLMVLLFIPAGAETANAAINKKRPTKVTLSSVKATSYNKVTLKWKKAKNLTSYVIYYKESTSKKWIKLKSVNAKTLSYTHKSSKKYPLKQGKTYQYRMLAYNNKASGKKKNGPYSSTKKVKIPKKATPTVIPTSTPKPTATPKPTVTPKPTSTPKPTATPKPKPTAIPKPTQVPQPTKPASVKVTRIALNPSSIKLTSKGQTSKIAASISPSNATNKGISWSSSNTNIVTVSADGTVTAKATGSATIYATANDGSGVKGSCQVTVDVPSYVTENVSLAGGENSSFDIFKKNIPDGGNFNNVTFEFKSNDNSCYMISHAALYDAYGASSQTITALKKGSVSVIAKYNGTIIKVWNVTITSDWTEYFNYYNWLASVESQIWNSGMTDTQKLRAAETYIKTHFGYMLGYCNAVSIYNKGLADCYGASDLMGDFAKDLNLKVYYCMEGNSQKFEYITDAASSDVGDHMYNLIFADGKLQAFDASN